MNPLNQTYQTVIEELQSVEKFHINLGLERTQKMLELLGNPQEDMLCIQVAGTNGKGSCCAMLESVLMEATYNTGLFTSPHIYSYTERFKVYGEKISEEDFVNYYKLVTSLANENDIKLTEFEILTVMMYKYFSDNDVDVALIETGLGGKLDATNAIKENFCSIITHIDFDHTDRLGDSLYQITCEKAGIIKLNSTVITINEHPAIEVKAKEMGAKYVLVDSLCSSSWLNEINLNGINQIENLSIVLKVLEEKFNHIPINTIRNGLKKIVHPCRFEYFPKQNMIIDGAHNLNAMDLLIKNLNKYYPNTKRQYIFNCLDTKDYSNMLAIILSDSNLTNLYYYKFSHPNACSYSKLAPAKNIRIKKLESKSDIKFTKDVLTVVCGSFYMIKELRDFLEV